MRMGGEHLDNDEKGERKCGKDEKHLKSERTKHYKTQFDKRREDDIKVFTEQMVKI